MGEEKTKNLKNHYLIRLSAPLGFGEGGGGPPQEIQLSPYGWVETETQGKYLMDEEAMGLVEAAFRRSNREVVIDYEHQTLYGGEAPAAGWTKALLEKGPEGLWAATSWTERAGRYLSAREYRYLSPVFLVRAKDRRPVQLHSIALTNSPEIRGLLPLVAGQGFSLFQHGRPAGSPLQEEDPMREWLIQILKLKAEASDEEIQAALKEQFTSPTMLDAQGHLVKYEKTADLVAHKEVLEALNLPETASLSEVTGTIHALKQPGNVVSMFEFSALKQKLAERERDELVAQALKDGKITPAQKEWADAYCLRDPGGFRVFTRKAPAVLPLESARLSGGASPGLPDETQTTINKLMGVSTEAFKKYYPNP